MQLTNRDTCGNMGYRFLSTCYKMAWLAVAAAGCLLMSLPAEAGPLRACMMPSYRQHLTYANAVINEPLTVWGRAWDGTGPYAYTLDFGDGTPVASGAVTDLRFIGQAHTYTIAGSKTATLTVTGAGETRIAQTVIRVFAAPTQEIRVNQAVDKGLLWMYKNQTVLSDTSAKWNYGALEYDVAATGFSLLAFEENGHLAAFDYEEDIYAETVKRGLNYLYGNATKMTLPVQTSGNPDSNGNTIGAYLFNNTYANGIAVSALAMAAQTVEIASNTVITVGAYANDNLLTLVQDLFDQFNFCQGDAAHLGAWRYTVNVADYGSYDGSAQQWPCLDYAIGKGRLGIQPPGWVIANAVKGFKTLQSANGGCGYSASGDWTNPAKTGGMLVGYSLGGKGNTDADVVRGLNYLGTYWCGNPNIGALNGGWAGDFYAMYGIKKGLHLQEVEKVTTPLGQRNWYADISAWLLGVKEGSAEALAGMPYIPNALAAGCARSNANGFGQYADGSWTSGSSYMPNAKVFGTPLGVLMLTKVVTVMGPLAIIAPVTPQPSLRPPVRVTPIPFIMDGRGSYHQDRSRSIIHYLWDWDMSDGVNWSNPDATGSRPTNPGYRAIGEYTVTLLVTDDSNPTMSNKTTTVVVVTDQDVAPIANPIPSWIPAYSGFIGKPILLDGGESYDPDGDTITNYTWDVNCNGVYGDAGDISSSLPTATVTFATEHIGSISLQVAAKNKAGNSNLSLADIYCTPTDLSVTNFMISDFVLNNRAYVHAEFKNAVESGSDYKNVLVRFFNGNPLTGGTQISPNIFVDLPRGVTVPLDTRLVNLYGVEPQDIYVYLDANMCVPEGDELNNVVSVATGIRRTIFVEDFEKEGTSIPAGWTQQSEINTIKWQIRTGGNNAMPPTAHDGSYNAQYQAQTTNANLTKLVTPAMNFGAATQDPKLTFWHCMTANPAHAPQGQDELRVYYKTSENGPWALLAEYTSNVTTWTERTLNLPNVGRTYYLGFEGKTQWGRGVCIDGIVVMASGPIVYDPVISTSSPLPPATVQADYGFRLAATGGGGVYSWSVVSNSLPKGLGLVPVTGVITGKPAVAGTTLFKVRVTGDASLYTEKTFSLTVQPALVISGKVTQNGTVTGMPDVILVLSGGGTTTTDANGNYSVSVKKGWTGTVSPIATPTAEEIIPSLRSYSNLMANAVSQNYGWWEEADSIPLADYALDQENAAFKYATVSGIWAYYLATDDLRCVSPAKSKSAAMQVTVTGPGLLSFTYELSGADGTNKLVCAVGASSRPARIIEGAAEVSVAVPAGVQIVKWTVTRGANSPEAVASVHGLVFTPLANMTTPTPNDGKVLKLADFAGLAWVGGNEYCRVYTGLSGKSLLLLGTTYPANAVPSADMAARLNAAAGKTVYWRVDAVKKDSFGVEAVCPGTVWSFNAPNVFPIVTPDQIYENLLLGVRYDLGPCVLQNAGGGTVTCEVKSGVVPPGMKAEIRNGSFYLSGVPTKVGNYKPVIQLSVKNGAVVTPGASITTDLSVAPLGLAAGTFDGWIENSAFGQGTVALTVSVAGAISGKIALGGSNYTFAATSYSGVTNDHLYALMDVKVGKKVVAPLLLFVWSDGRITAQIENDSPDARICLFRNNWKEPGMADVLTNYLGYYTVTLPVTNRLTDASPQGCGFMSLTVSAGGAVKFAGILADGNSFSYAGTLLYEPKDASTGEDAKARVVLYTIPSVYKGVGAVFGVLKIVHETVWDWAYAGQNVVVAHLPVIWWNFTPQSVAGYNPTTGAGKGGFSCKLDASGGYYNKLEPLQTYYENRALSFVATGAPADYDGYNNAVDTGFTFVSGPEDVAVTPTATGFSIVPRTLVKVPGTTLTDLDKSVNPWGLTLVFNKTTGLFNGSFAAYYENAAATLQKTVTLAYKGILTPVREKPEDEDDAYGFEGRGFYLVPDRCYYKDARNVLKNYTFYWSYDMLLPSVLIP